MAKIPNARKTNLTKKRISRTAVKSKNIYKYVGPERFDAVFQSANFSTLKCSLPGDFNDPYELFLTIDFNERPDALAYYADLIGDLPQHPTTCFSRSPIVLPMWAHYAQNLSGFVIEFSEDELARGISESTFDDVTYSDSPKSELSEMLYRAYVIGKFRYAYFLQRGVLHTAYFTKASCWSYEQERRLVVPTSATPQEGQLTLLDVPCSCITSVIAGPRAGERTKQLLAQRAKHVGCNYFELRIGRSSAIPFLVDQTGQPFIHPR
jgi:hypothetical protein